MTGVGTARRVARARVSGAIRIRLGARTAPSWRGSNRLVIVSLRRLEAPADNVWARIVQYFRTIKISHGALYPAYGELLPPAPRRCAARGRAPRLGRPVPAGDRPPPRRGRRIFLLGRGVP